MIVELECSVMSFDSLFGPFHLASCVHSMCNSCALTACAVCVQFGKVDSCTYIMDYNPADISAVQAFAISLSTFETKLLL